MSIFYSTLKNFNFNLAKTIHKNIVTNTIRDWYEVFNRRFFTHRTWILPVNWFTAHLIANKMSEQLLSTYLLYIRH